MNLRLKNTTTQRFNQVFFQKQAGKNFNDTIFNLKNILNFFSFFNLSFYILFAVEIFTIALLFAFLSSSTFLALMLATIFLTCFSYFILFFYFQGKKNEKINHLLNKFVISCRRALSLPLGSAEHHLTVAKACSNLSESIISIQTELEKLNFLSFVKKVSYYFQREDFFKFRENLLIAAAKEHIAQLQHTPTDLEVHTALSSTYTKLSKLYLDTKKIFNNKTKIIELDNKYTSTIKCALEEFKILNDYAPNDPWIRLQLAKSYNILDMKIDETKEYQILYKLCPNDNNILYKLGTLYFEMGKNSKGLRVYEELKIRSFKNADTLLSYYSIFKIHENINE